MSKKYVIFVVENEKIMAVSKEHIVSLKIAKLLKEKGFNEWCRQSYGMDVRYKGRSIDFDEECDLKDEGYGDDPAVEACSVDELEAADMLPADMLQWLQVDKEAMDELFDTVTLPFLRLPIVAYLDYLNTIPELAKLNLYEAWFRRDVEAWREQYRSEPTIADVLYRSIERFKVIADDWDRQFCLMSDDILQGKQV